MSTKGWPYSIGLKYKPNISLSSSLARRAPGIARLDRIACSGEPMVVSIAGASLIAYLDVLQLELRSPTMHKPPWKHPRWPPPKPERH